MAKKLNSNPQIAYLQGKKEGYEMGGKETIQYARHFAVLALYNISHLYTRSEKQSNELVKAFFDEQERIYAEEFWGAPDTVRIAAEGVKRIYKELGIEVGGMDIG